MKKKLTKKILKQMERVLVMPEGVHWFYAGQTIGLSGESLFTLATDQFGNETWDRVNLSETSRFRQNYCHECHQFQERTMGLLVAFVRQFGEKP